MQPLRTKKSRNLSGQKKNHATSWDKKIMQPHGKKLSCNLLGQKNHAASQDNKKKSHNLSGHNHAQKDKIR